MFSKLFALEIHHIATFCTTFTHFGVFIISQTPPKRKGVSEIFLFFYQLFSQIMHVSALFFHILVFISTFYSFTYYCLPKAYILPHFNDRKMRFLAIFEGKNKTSVSANGKIPHGLDTRFSSIILFLRCLDLFPVLFCHTVVFCASFLPSVILRDSEASKCFSSP